MDEVKVDAYPSFLYHSHSDPRHDGAGHTAAAPASEYSPCSTNSILPSESEKAEQEVEQDSPEQEVRQDLLELEAPPSLLAWFLGVALDQLPRQLNLYLHLRMPALYRSRVSRVFQDANMSMSEIKFMALELARDEGPDRLLGNLEADSYPTPRDSAPWTRLRSSWELFITSLVAEWSTLNIISALLLSAILTILQIESAMAWPLARFSALLSLLCALMSLLYGCLYIIRFSTMKRTTRAAEWAFESQRKEAAIFWNVWIMLSLPAVWLVWAMIFFVTCVMTMVWRTGSVDDGVAPELSFSEALVPRTIISGVLVLGLLYLALIISTMMRYGDAMDKAWQERVKSWVAEIKAEERNHTTSSASRSSNVHVAGYTRRSGYTYSDSGWRSPSQVSVVGEPRPVVPFLCAPVPGAGRGSIDSWDLYQERYSLHRLGRPPRASSRPRPRVIPPMPPFPDTCMIPYYLPAYQPSGYYWEDDGAEREQRLALPPSDNRIFREKEYIDLKVSRWLNEVQKNSQSEDQSHPSMPPAAEDEASAEMPPIEKGSESQLQQTGVVPKDPSLGSSSTKDGDNGEGVGAMGLGESNRKTEPGKERVVCQLDGVDMDRPSIPLVGRCHSPEEPSYQQSEPEPHEDTTRGAPEENIEPSPTTSGPTKMNPEVPRHNHSAPRQSPLSTTREDEHFSLDSALTPSAQSDQDESPAAQHEIRLDGPALQPTLMDGLQSTDNVQLGAHRVLPYPGLQVGAQGFSKEGALVKILHLQNQGAGGGHEAPTPHISIPDDVSPQIWRTFTLDILSAWSNLGYGERVSVTCELNQLWWSPQEQRAFVNFTALIEVWSSTVFKGLRRRLVVVGEEHIRDDHPNLRDIVFAVYMAPLDADPLVVEVEGGTTPASLIRFNCWNGCNVEATSGSSSRADAEPDIYVRECRRVPAANSSPESG